MKCACYYCEVQVAAYNSWCSTCVEDCKPHVPASVSLTRVRWYGTMTALLVVWLGFFMTPGSESVVATERFSFMIVGALAVVAGLPYILKDD